MNAVELLADQWRQRPLGLGDTDPTLAAGSRFPRHARAECLAAGRGRRR